jgi:hypothetical protein
MRMAFGTLWALAGLVTPVAAVAADVVLVEHKQARATVYSPGESEFAGRRLAGRLRDLTGALVAVQTIPGVPEGSDTVVAVGTPESNPAVKAVVEDDARLARLGEEGYILKVGVWRGVRVLVAGGTALPGVNNAVSELVSWKLKLSEDGAAVSGDLDEADSPELKYRILWTSDGQANWSTTVGEMHTIQKGTTGTTVVPYTRDGFLTHFKRSVEFISDHKLNGYIIWGFLRDEHGGLDAGRVLSRYAKQRNVRILPGVCTQAAYGGFIYSQTDRFSLVGWLKMHPELRGRGKDGKIQMEAICPSKPENQKWLREGAEWLFQNLPDIGGVNLENGDLQECYTDDCVKAKARPENDPNFLWDMMATQRPIIEVAQRLRPNAWMTFATYVGFREATLRGLKDSPQYPPKFLAQYPPNSICQWTFTGMATPELWPSGEKPPTAAFADHIGLLHHGSLWGAPVEAARWWTGPGAMLDDCSTVIQFVCGRVKSCGLPGLVIKGQTGVASPANELNYLAFEYFSWHPDRTYEQFLDDRLTACYGGTDRARLFLKLLRNTTKVVGQIETDRQTAAGMAAASDLDLRQRARWRNLADELTRRLSLLPPPTTSPATQPAAAGRPADAVRQADAGPAPAPEYSYEQACKDWIEIPARITVIGAKHSPFHAAVYADGTLALAGTAWCEADRWLLAYGPDRLLLSFGFGDPPDFNRTPQEQRLEEGSLPVVVTRVTPTPTPPVISGGCRYEQHVVTHLLGTEEAKTGREPLIARTRIDIRNPQPSPARAVIWVQFSAMEHKTGVDPKGEWLLFSSHQPQPTAYEGGALALAGNAIVDSRNRVRALVETPDGSNIGFHPKYEPPADLPAWRALRGKGLLYNLLRIEVPVAGSQTAIVRLTVPAFPLEADQARALAADAFDQAWDRTLVYWRAQLGRAATLSVPEPALMDMIRSYPWQVMVKMDTDPETGAIIPKVNALLYEAVWGHITAWECNALDYLGYHAEAARYLQPFLEWQGQPRTTGKAEGITDWSGFLGANLKYTYWNWAAHHGYLMWELSEHYLLTGDEAWFRQVRPGLLKAADWTIQELATTRKTDAAGQRALNWGLFPASISTDLTQHLDNAAFNDAWIYRGLATVGEALRVAGDSRAGQIAARAEEYRQDIRAAWRRAIAQCPPQTLTDGSKVPFVPGLLHMRDWRETQGKNMGPGFLVFYLMDTGPLHLGQCGVFGAGNPSNGDDREMEWALQLIRDGPPDVRFLTHGVSTCEICFAPQFDYYLAIDAPERAIEVLYSSLAGGMSRRTFSAWEFRGGIQFMPVAVGEVVRQLRLMLVHECPGDELWLAQATPRAWLADGQKIEVRNAPTRFGEISYVIRSEVGRGRIIAEVTVPQRRPAKLVRLRLRHPQGLPIRAVEIDGRAHDGFSGEWIALPAGQTLHVTARY